MTPHRAMTLHTYAEGFRNGVHEKAGGDRAHDELCQDTMCEQEPCRAYPNFEACREFAMSRDIDTHDAQLCGKDLRQLAQGGSPRLPDGVMKAHQHRHLVE
jgi:hypothetical protein